MYCIYTSDSIITKVGAIITLLALVLGAFLGFGMSMNGDGSMSVCPSMNYHGVLCPMGALEHMGAWRDFFMAVIYPSTLALLSSIMITMLARVLTLDPLDTKRFIVVFLVRRRTMLQLFDHLLISFSQGILNPKIYGA